YFCTFKSLVHAAVIVPMAETDQYSRFWQSILAPRHVPQTRHIDSQNTNIARLPIRRTLLIQGRAKVGN
ncbi:MAG TPA: hypothetical protein DIW77_15930, partial [Chromatiaceae bacterium]|nr:hypothetical protein [Chromatiaceae bacterium]